MKILLSKISILLSYFFSSTLTTLMNKYMFNVLNYSKHYLLIAFQSLFIVFIILIYNCIKKSKIKIKNHKKWYLTSLLLSLMLFSNNKSIYYLPITLFTLYKNISIILIALIELKIFKNKITIFGYISFILMILSSYPGNFTDYVPLIGYFWILLNVISTAAYMVHLKFLMNLENSSRTEAIFFCNLLSLPIILILSIKFDEKTANYSSKLILFIIFSSFSSFLTAFSTAWTLKIFSSTTLSMIGALNKLLLSGGSFLIFSENFNLLKIVSLIIGITSGIIYSLSKIQKEIHE